MNGSIDGGLETACPDLAGSSAFLCYNRIVGDAYRFVVDNNSGKLARWLRLMGYDAVLFNGTDDSDMVAAALAQSRVIITRDTQIAKRRLVRNGQLRVVLIRSDDPEAQIRQVIGALSLDCRYREFALCLECNVPLEIRRREEVEGRVPPYVFQTQRQYTECPRCHRIYWRGTHWQAMAKRLAGFCAAAAG